MIKLTDIVKDMGLELGKVYTDRDLPAFKTPLFTVQGYIETLLDGAMKDKNVAEKYLERANKGVERLIYIVKDLETNSFYEIPKQAVLIDKLRNAGWDKKVKIGEFCNHSIDGILDGVGICGYFGHKQAAFQKLLALQSLYEDGEITECYYITQSIETSELRHQRVNPNAKPGTNGNRIAFDDIVSAMGYYHR